MNELRGATLFNLDTERIARVKYIKMDGMFYLKDLQELDELKKRNGAYPDEVFILLDDSESPFLISLFELTAEDEGTEGSELVGRRIIPVRHENIRQDVRISVAMDIEISSPAFSQIRIAEMRNISSSGLMFVSDEAYEKEMVLSVAIPISEPPIRVPAVVKNKIPIRSRLSKNTIGYGCMFAIIDKKTESKIRQYVFQQEVSRRKGFHSR